MKSWIRPILLFLLWLVFPLAAVAQESNEYHPYFTHDFELGVGAFFANKELTVKVNGRDPGDNINIDEAAKLDNDEVTGALAFHWRFGEKWSFWAQGWKVSESGGSELIEDVHWNDVVFKQGTFIEGGFDVAVGRLFFGRTFSSSPNHEFGLGAGIHWMELDVFLQGQALTSLGDTEFYRGKVEAEFPLPNIGGWYHWSWSPNWMLQARVDWLSASIGDYSGGLLNSQAGVYWQPFEHVGFGFYYSGFTLDVDIKKSNWNGSAESTQHGPLIAIYSSW